MDRSRGSWAAVSFVMVPVTGAPGNPGLRPAGASEEHLQHREPLTRYHANRQQWQRRQARLYLGRVVDCAANTSPRGIALKHTQALAFCSYQIGPASTQSMAHFELALRTTMPTAPCWARGEVDFALLGLRRILIALVCRSRGMSPDEAVALVPRLCASEAAHSLIVCYTACVGQCAVVHA